MASWPRLSLWSLVCVLLLLGWWALDARQPRLAGVCHDDGTYLSLGRSLAVQAEYRDGHSPEPIRIAKYPPALPLLAALGWSIAEDVEGVLTFLRVCNLLFLALGLAALTRILLCEGFGLCTPLVVCIVGFSPGVLDYVRVAMSECAYFGVATWTLWLLLRERNERESWRGALVLAALCVLAFAIRSFGGVVWLTVVGSSWLAHRRKTAVRVAAVGFVGILAIYLFVRAHAAPAAGYEDITVYGLPYGRIFADSLGWIDRTIFKNGLQFLFFAVHAVVPPIDWLAFDNWVAVWIAGVVLSVLVFVGVREARLRGPVDGFRPWHLFVLLSVVLMLPWPASVGRFLMPIAPFLLLELLRGLRRIGGSRTAVGAAAGLAVATAAVSLDTRALGDRFVIEGRALRTSDLIARVEAIGRSVGDGVVASTLDPLLAHHGGVRGVWGWTITADEHLYKSSLEVLRFGFERQRDWLIREIFAARLLFLEQARDPNLPRARADVVRRFGVPDPSKHGAEREPLLASLESDRASVREQFRRLGVTHAVIAPREGNTRYEVLLARLVRELVAEGMAKPVPEVSSDLFQLWQIEP